MYDPSTGRWLSEDPIDFLGEDANLYRYVGNGPTKAADPTGLYEKDIHYYMTYYIAYAVGIPDKNAREIAWACQFVDEHRRTEPLQDYSIRPGAVAIRRKFHFRTSGNAVVAGSKEAAEIVDAAINAIGPKPKNKVQIRDLNFLMGIGLHAYEDSWSHATYGPRKGHRGGRGNPDYPYLDPQKAMRMAKAVYEKLKLYKEKHFPKAKERKAFNQINVTLEKLMEGRGTEDQRAVRWRRRIQRDFNQNIFFDAKFGKEIVWAEEFSEIADTVKPPGVKPKAP